MSRFPLIGHLQFAEISKSVLVGVAVVIAMAVPVYAGSAVEDAEFLAALDKTNISYDSPGQAIAAGNAVCQLMDEGGSGIEVIWQLVTTNQGLNSDTARKFAGIAAGVYCPQYATTFDGTAGL